MTAPARPRYRGYFALVLSDASRAALAARFASLAKPFCHHLTVVFGTDSPADLPARFSAADVGRKFTLRVIGFARSARIEAVAIALIVDGEPVMSGFSANAVPHITVGTDGVAKPFESNALLAQGFEPISGGLELEVTLQHVM